MTKNEPLDKQLYARVTADAKKKFLKWPSAYASGWVVRTYKDRGGRYASTANDRPLKRWYDEEWIDVCSYVKDKTIRSCGRSRAEMKDYPYCRPRKRISSQTPTTMQEIIEKDGIQQLRDRCEKKKKNPARRII